MGRHVRHAGRQVRYPLAGQHLRETGLTPFIVRRALPADLPAIGALGAALLRQHYEFDRRRFMAPGEHPEQGYAWFLGTELDRDDAVVLVADRGGELLGYVFAGIEPQSWKELREQAGFVHDLLTVAAEQGHGVGRALLDAAIEWLRARGIPRVLLWTAAGNAGAQRLFERRGFRRTMIEMTLETDDDGDA